MPAAPPKMATYNTYSQSLRVQAADPATPYHSPHHSVNSSTSSRTRTPLHPLTIHQYRKQQNSPAPQLATPPGKTLRRRPATPALNELERKSSLSNTPLSASCPTERSLHFSLSAQQLAYQSLPPSPPPCDHHALLGQPFRSQSAEPYSQLGVRSRQDTAEKVRKFKPIKRLPKPPAATGFGLPSPPAITPTPSQYSLGYASLLEDSIGGDLQQSPSARSIAPLSYAPIFDEHALSRRVNAASFTANAPETPPATPAVIHYRGASFDLLNPHDSLCLANIVTPSRDLDSTDYLPLPSSDERSAIDEMGPKRALYVDLSEAHASIRARPTANLQDASTSELAMPPPARLPDTPTSPDEFTPLNTGDSISPSASSPSTSRFSLKQLTRNLTRKLAKSPEAINEQELQDMSEMRPGLASPTFQGEFPRPLEDTYREVHSNFARLSSAPQLPVDEQSALPRLRLAAPDDTNTSTRPHRGDGDSLYASSSLYPDQTPRQSYYEPGPAGDRRSNIYSGTVANVYGSSPGLLNSRRSSRRDSRRLERNTDTIAHLIDEYKEEEEEGAASTPEMGRGVRPTSLASENPAREDPGSLAQPFEYDELFGSAPYFDTTDTTNSGITTYGDTRQLLQLSGPIFEDTRQPELQASSSYSQQDSLPRSPPISQDALDQADQIFGNTSPNEHLGHTEEPEEQKDIPAMWTGRSSGILIRSKDEVDETSEKERDDTQAVPSSSQAVEGEEIDWETVRNSSQTQPSGKFESGESVADYSSSEGSRESRDSLGFPSAHVLPAWRQSNNSHNSYRHPSPQQVHINPFTSSPPLSSPLPLQMRTSQSGRTRGPTSPPPLSPPPIPPLQSPRNRSGNVIGAEVLQSSTPPTPWVNRDQFSDRETEELLASGPNDEILYENDQPTSSNNVAPTGPHHHSFNSDSSETLPTIVHRTSLRDSSANRVARIPSAQLRTLRSHKRSSITTPGQFYTTPGRTSSISRVYPGYMGSNPHADTTDDSPPSQTTLYPITDVPAESEREQERARIAGDMIEPLPRRARRESRAAVHSQTRLRQMVLAAEIPPSIRSTVHSRTTRSERPSTSNSATPLTPRQAFIPSSTEAAIVNTPRLLCPERKANPDEETERSIKSWVIFTALCVFPPLLLLYGYIADFVIVNITKGRLTHAAARPKKHALVVSCFLCLLAPFGVIIWLAVKRSMT